MGQIEIPFEPVAGGSEGAMIAEAKSAVATGDPMLMMFWQPHWLFAEMDMEWVVLGRCWMANASKKSGQTRGNACGFQQASIDKIMNKDFRRGLSGGCGDL